MASRRRTRANHAELEFVSEFPFLRDETQAFVCAGSALMQLDRKLVPEARSVDICSFKQKQESTSGSESRSVNSRRWQERSDTFIFVLNTSVQLFNTWLGLAVARLHTVSGFERRCREALPSAGCEKVYEHRLLLFCCARCRARRGLRQYA